MYVLYTHITRKQRVQLVSVIIIFNYGINNIYITFKYLRFSLRSTSSMDSYSTRYLKINQLRPNCTNISYLFITVWQVNRCLLNNLINNSIHGFIDFLFPLNWLFYKREQLLCCHCILDLIEIIDDPLKSYEAMFFLLRVKIVFISVNTTK